MNKFSIKNEKILFILILIIVIATRLLALDKIPSGMNQDEAFISYEAFSLLTTGADSWGNSFSVYLPTWGQGASPLYGYFIVPFFWLFGISTLSARLPQALFGILSCYLFFRLATLMCNKRVGFIAFFLSAIMPWHIMMSRYGIEVNFAPFFVLTGFYFFIKSYQALPYLCLSALFYGLGIYAFDCCAIYITLSFGFQLFCRLWHNFERKTILYILLSGLLFSIIISPFLLLIAVNNNLIPEIKSSFITVPKMHYWKQSHISVSGFFHKLKKCWDIIYFGNDRFIHHSVKEFGLFYFPSLPFIAAGFYTLIRNAFLKTNDRRNNIILLGTLIIGILYSGLLNANVNRLNYLWFNTILLLAIGIDHLFTQKKYLIFIIGLYSCFFISFCWFYFTQYNEVAKNRFHPDLEQSLQLASKEHETSDYPIYIIAPKEVYPKILFFNRISPKEFRETVQWHTPHKVWLHAKSFLFYHIQPQIKKIVSNAIYIAPISEKHQFSNFDISEFGEFIVAVPKN